MNWIEFEDMRPNNYNKKILGYYKQDDSVKLLNLCYGELHDASGDKTCPDYWAYIEGPHGMD